MHVFWCWSVIHRQQFPVSFSYYALQIMEITQEISASSDDGGIDREDLGVNDTLLVSLSWLCRLQVFYWVNSWKSIRAWEAWSLSNAPFSEKPRSISSNNASIRRIWTPQWRDWISTADWTSCSFYAVISMVFVFGVYQWMCMEGYLVLLTNMADIGVYMKWLFGNNHAVIERLLS